MKKWLRVLVLLVILLSLPVNVSAHKPDITVEHIVLISIDGLRPEALELANTPVIDELRQTGIYFDHNTSVLPSETLPNHATMATGVLPAKHGLDGGLPPIGKIVMQVPTLFTEAKQAGLSTALVIGKTKLDYLAMPGGVDILRYGPYQQADQVKDDIHDDQIRDASVEIIKESFPSVMFIHFPDVDRRGHGFGWLSEQQLGAVTFVDTMIGDVVGAVKATGKHRNTIFIITADHGGHDKHHGDDYWENTTIPWLAAGPGIPQNKVEHRQIHQEDTTPTILALLDIPQPEIMDGIPVSEVLPK